MPASTRMSDNMDAVVVLPCVPATARQRRVAQMAASTSERGATRMPRARASTSSGLSAATAGEYVTASAPADVLGPVTDRDGDAVASAGARPPASPSGPSPRRCDPWRAGPDRWRSCRRRRCRRCGSVAGALEVERTGPASAGMGVDQFGDTGGRVGVRLLPGGGAHGAEALGIGQQRVELVASRSPSHSAIGHVHGGAPSAPSPPALRV